MWSKPIQFLGIKDTENLLFQSFTFVLLSTLVLPLFPFWDIVIIWLSLAFLANAHHNKIIKSCFWLLLGFSFFLFIKYIFSFASLISFLYGTFFNHELFGLKYPELISISLLCTQIVILGSLLQINYIKYKKDKPYLFYIIGVSLFALFTNISSLINFSFSEQVNLNCLIIPAMYFSLYFNNQKNVQFVLKYIIFAAVLVACLVIFQHLIQDYSYLVLSTLRVKATYYYHSAASLFLALSLFFIFQYKKIDQFKLIDWVSVILIVNAIFLNSTRAISLSLVIAMLYMLTHYTILKSYRNSVFSLIIITVFSGSVLYIKKNALTENPITEVSADKTNNSLSLTEKTNLNTNQKHDSPLFGEREASVEDLSELNKSKDLYKNTFDAISTKIILYIKNNMYRFSIINHEGNFKSSLFSGSGIGKSLATIKRGSMVPKQRKSTHSLIVDILILTGVFSLVSFLGIFLTPLLFKRDEKVIKSYKINYIGSIFFIFSVSLFFPKEQNYLVMLFFLIPLLYISMLEMNYKFKENESKGASFDLFKAFAIISSLIYIFLFSPRYILPTIEFHYANFVIDKNKYNHPIFTNSLPLKYILEGSFKLLKGQDIEAHMLEDNLNKLPDREAWVFWDPLKETNYPTLMSAIGQTEYSEYGFWDRLERPTHWKSIRLYLTALTLFKIQPSEVQKRVYSNLNRNS